MSNHPGIFGIMDHNMRYFTTKTIVKLYTELTNTPRPNLTPLQFLSPNVERY